jgi:hypothetical protein
MLVDRFVDDGGREYQNDMTVMATLMDQHNDRMVLA